MPRIKICGITNVEDGLQAAQLGADALGFVFYPQSPRFVEAEHVRNIIELLPPFISTVGLFVNEKAARVREVMEFCRLDIAQLHGDEVGGDIGLANRRVIRALRVRDETSLQMVEKYQHQTLLLDAWVKDRMGGTGQTFDWNLAARVSDTCRILLAGGLTPENVTEAIHTVRPYGVDVSSGVESSPGRKDTEKMALFIQNVRKA